MDIVDKKLLLCHEIFHDALTNYMRQQGRTEAITKLRERPPFSGSTPPGRTFYAYPQQPGERFINIALGKLLRLVQKELQATDRQNPVWTKVYFSIERNNRATCFWASLCLYK
jgi:hypothetical protein